LALFKFDFYGQIRLTASALSASVALDPNARTISQSADKTKRLARVRAMYYVILTIPLAQHDLFLEKA
jgi:hypothetical protein